MEALAKLSTVISVADTKSITADSARSSRVLDLLRLARTASFSPNRVRFELSGLTGIELPGIRFLDLSSEPDSVVAAYGLSR
jgi:hypothetical protein